MKRVMNYFGFGNARGNCHVSIPALGYECWYDFRQGILSIFGLTIVWPNGDNIIEMRTQNVGIYLRNNWSIHWWISKVFSLPFRIPEFQIGSDRCFIAGGMMYESDEFCWSYAVGYGVTIYVDR